MTVSTPIVRDLGLAQYEPVCEAMRVFTRTRTPETPDEIWFVEHPAVYTAGRDALQRCGSIGDVPLVPVERGGDITFHAPGQMVVYPLLDLRRRHLFVKTYVSLLLETLIDTLAAFGIESIRHPGAPGVYVPMPGAWVSSAESLKSLPSAFMSAEALRFTASLSTCTRIWPVSDASRHAATRDCASSI